MQYRLVGKLMSGMEFEMEKLRYLSEYPGGAWLDVRKPGAGGLQVRIAVEELESNPLPKC